MGENVFAFNFIMFHWNDTKYDLIFVFSLPVSWGRHPISFVSWHPPGEIKYNSIYTVMMYLLCENLFIIIFIDSTRYSLIFSLLWENTLIHALRCTLQVEHFIGLGAKYDLN